MLAVEKVMTSVEAFELENVIFRGKIDLKLWEDEIVFTCTLF